LTFPVGARRADSRDMSQPYGSSRRDRARRPKDPAQRRIRPRVWAGTGREGRVAVMGLPMTSITGRASGRANTLLGCVTSGSETSS